ncbi:MAG: hypothetical protein CMP23_00845 [Rickettsiales bacterium]|nr:hypothetical protein [Rickettsiales bacterium]|tara:strand:- start:897 stop:2657 length:1761 start_codon:yes stop_codon:yes gene_type:complete
MSRLASHVLLGLLVLLTWSACVHSGHVNFDTPWMVLQSPLRELGLAEALRLVLWDLGFATRHALGAEYLPVRDLSVWLDLQLWPDNYRLHHLHNLLLHLTLCALTLELMRELLGPSRMALWAAALFAVHPAHAESVAWLVGRKDLLAGVFVVLGLLSWLRSGEGRFGRLFGLLCMLLACWSKKTAVVFPLLLLLILALSAKERRGAGERLAGVGMALIMLLVVGTSLAVGEQMGFLAERRGDGLLELLWFQCWILMHYLGSFFAPWDLSVLYPEPTLGPSSSGPLWLAPTLTLAFLALLAWSWRRAPLVALGLAWFLVAQLPTSQLVPLQNLVADRYLFLPSLGLALALAVLGSSGPPRFRSAAGLILALLVLTGALAARERCAVWQDSVALWADVVDKHPELARGHTALAGALAAAGRHEQARGVIERGLLRLPGDAQLLEASGLRWLESGDLERAEEAWRGALAREPRRRKAANNLALVLRQMSRNDEALLVAQQLVRTHPAYPRGLTTLGTLLFEQGDLVAAERALQASVELDPRQASTLCNLGSVAFRQAQYDSADRWWQRCLELEPEHPIAVEGLHHLGRP